MCGIAGCVETGANAESLADLGWDLTERLRRRGPDGRGVHVIPEHGVVLAHTRLAVLGLGPEGQQPMESADGRYVISYNGEIYNHLELRELLMPLGHAFRGHSDTETVLAAIVSWGLEATLKACRGMFAMAVFDRRESALYLARDRFGQKPLYHGHIGKRLIFLSDLDAIGGFGPPPAIDRSALADYFRSGAVPGDRSIFEGIGKVGPGQIVEYRRRGCRWERVGTSTFWSVEQAARQGVRTPFAGTESEAVDELDRVISDAVDLRMLSDVPIGAMLSGGVDSSLVAALMQRHSAKPVKTFTVAFAQSDFDESPAALAVSQHLGTDHDVLTVGPGDLLALLPDLPAMSGEPFADPSQIPTHLICRHARRSVTVCLTGDGGDELFGGYPWVRRGARVSRAISPIPPPIRRMLAAASGGLADRVGGSFGRRAATLERLLDVHDVRDARFALTGAWKAGTAPVLGIADAELVVESAQNWPDLPELEQQLLWLDCVRFLPDTILTKADRASMAASLEGRAPLLDTEVAEFAWSLPTDWKLGPRPSASSATNKWILRQLLYRYVPSELVDRPKQGFDVPIGSWLGDELQEWAQDLLSPSSIKQDGYLDNEAIQKVWQDHRHGRADHTNRLWSVLMFQAWLQHLRDGRATPAPA